MKLILIFLLTVLTVSCASLYKEHAYVTEVAEVKNGKGECKSECAQNRFSFTTKKGKVLVSTPIHYDYWWTGPVVIPLFPITKERPDPSFIKITFTADEGVLDREELLKSEIHIQKTTDPILPMNAVYTHEKKIERYVVQFDSPKLVDLKSFSLKLVDTMMSGKIHFQLAHNTHYVPIVPVSGSECVTD
jgi:hypothetical protein